MMEEDVEVWQQMFQELMQEVKPWHKWTLTPDKDLLPDVLKSGWTQYQQKTFARFHCSSCSRSWVSGRVLMLFHMRWCEKKGKGQVKMRVFAQRCNQCPEPPFAAPEFTWDNISRILNNLLFRILKKCYKEGFMQVGEIPLLGDTSLQGPHDSNNCEACLHGFCVQSGLGPASQAPAPPLSPTSSKSAKKPKVTASYSNVPCPQPSSNVEKSQASKVNPKASNSTKDDPKASHTSKQSTVPILTTQQLSLVSPPTPRCVTQMLSPIESNRAADVANKSTRSKAPKASASLLPSSSSDLPTSSSSVPPTSSSYVALTSSFVVSSSKVEKPQTSKVKPKTSNPIKDDPKVNHISKPSTTPILTIQQLSHVSSPTPRCVIQMPSPILSSRAADVAKKSTRSNTQKASLSSSSYAPPTSSSYAPPTYSLYSPLTSSSYAPPTPSFVVPTPSSHVVPNSWRPANTTCQIERSSHVHSQSESFCCKACCEGCGACCEAFCKGCCECFCECPCKICCACCEVCGNCMSQNPCLVFLIFVVIVVVLIIKYGL